MLIEPIKLKVALDPVAIGLLRAVGIVVVTQHLADLIHKFMVLVGYEFLLVFHNSDLNNANPTSCLIFL